VYGIVKGHDGYIMCYSEPNAGATFKIYLPAIPHGPDGAASGDTMLPARGGNETVLLVDDEESVRELGKSVLTRFGYTVLLAPDGETALEIYQKKEPYIDLVILDLIMPGMGGKRCLEELLKSDPGAKVLIASGSTPSGPDGRLLRAWTEGFVRKPFQVKELLDAIRQALGGH
jgi:CheY-like chemotaxis protein